MAALRAETNTEISVAGTRNPPWEVDFSLFTQIEPKRCSFDASRRAISGVLPLGLAVAEGALRRLKT